MAEYKEFSVPDVGGVSGIEDGLKNISLSSTQRHLPQVFPCSLCLQCNFCYDNVCSNRNKVQYWIGDIRKSLDPNFIELQDPKYTKKCPLPMEYIRGTLENRTINLLKIEENLHHVIDYIKESSSPYKELESLMHNAAGDSLKFLCQIDELIKSITAYNRKEKGVSAPYTYEILQTLMYPILNEDDYSSNIYFIDCEHMLKVSMPQQNAYSDFLKGGMFKPKDHKSTEIFGESDKFRWIFIPSSDRFDKDVILDRSHFKENGVMSTRDTLCFVVVRENQFDSYRHKIGDKLPIIQLPENVIGVGYARFWIVKIAKCFKLENIWMIDDSVDSFKAYIPTKNGNKYEKDPEAKDRTLNIRCPEYCFHKMESIMETQSNIVAISPRKYRPNVNVTYEFSQKPIQSVMLLNITKLTEKNINFRPELRYMEDMIFSQECKSAGLQLCTWNAILFVDTTFRTTGANTPNQSPRGKTQT